MDNIFRGGEPILKPLLMQRQMAVINAINMKIKSVGVLGASYQRLCIHADERSEIEMRLRV